MVMTPSASLDDSLTAVIGSSGMSYRHVRELGQGGMARIYLAYGMGAGGFTKLVVLKMLRRHLAADEAIRQMFQAEARLSARLNHPNLVQVYEVVEAEVPFLVMEYLDGKPLSAVRTANLVTPPMLLNVIAEALIGLHHAHTLCDYDGSPLNIVHRDISPHNIFMTYDGAVKILDFGIATTAAAGVNTDVGEVKGKIAYMAPEQLMGEEVDRRADVFSVGCMLWEAAVGSRMWENLSEPRLMHQLITGNIPRPSERASIEPELEVIIRKATAPARDQRYQSALELHHDLVGYLVRSNLSWSMRDVGALLAETFKEERESQKKALGAALVQPLAPRESPVRTTDVPVSATPPQSSRQSVWAVAVVALLLATLVMGWLFFRSREGERTAAPASALPAPALVDINIRATPSETKIEIDGDDRGTHGVALRVEADARDHVIEASAPGYLPQTRTIKFDRSQDVEMVLGKMAPAEPDPPGAAALPRKPALPRAAASAGPANKTDEPSCNPGYYYENGIKTYKPECL